jgi:hypothetical protein
MARIKIAFFILNFSFAAQAFAIDAPKPPEDEACSAKMKAVISDCAEEKARVACDDHDEDFDDCVGNKTSHYLAGCKKTEAFAWCHKCRYKPPGCAAMKKKVPAKKKHIHHVIVPQEKPGS